MLSSETAVVTGAASGIGRAIALTFAENGADVVVADVRREPIDDGAPTDELVAGKGREGTFVRTDVTSEDDVAALFDEVEDRFGGPTVLVNNVGTSRNDIAVRELSLEDWRRILDVNLTSAFLCSKYALPSLLSGDGGAIVNVSSPVGLQSTDGFAAYSASKAGMTNLTRSLVVDYRDEGLRANSIHPAPVKTAGFVQSLEESTDGDRSRIFDRGRRPARTDEVADVALFLASDMASYVNGEAIVVDDGLSATYY